MLVTTIMCMFMITTTPKRKRKRKPYTPTQNDRSGLTARQEAFCTNYVERSAEFANASDAYRGAYNCAGKKSATVNRRASEMLANPRVQKRIKELREKLARNAEFKIADVLNHWIAIATADPNDIIQHRRTCCRFCHGINHQYQWTAAEYALSSAQALQNKLPTPEVLGGFGYDVRKDPHPGCPECNGDGLSNVYIADTRKLTGAAKLLYGGIKQTRAGTEIILRSKDQALENIAKFLGMFKDKLATPIGTAASPLIGVITATNDPVEASKIYQKIMQDD